MIETLFSRQDRGATYSEITNEFDLPKSSPHRVLKDLTDLDYLNYHPVTKRYFGS
ncbi:MAG: helix-turn-helix domain-containing protein [Desulfofustis sp.]|nr:helix-turn-helix domain-containing protein [Desulfofustis sp.]